MTDIILLKMYIVVLMFAVFGLLFYSIYLHNHIKDIESALINMKKESNDE